MSSPFKSNLKCSSLNTEDLLMRVTRYHYQSHYFVYSPTIASPYMPQMCWVASSTARQLILQHSNNFKLL